MAQTETIVDTSVLSEVVNWIKTLKEVGVSADCAANVTAKFLIAAAGAEEEEEFEDYFEE